MEYITAEQFNDSLFVMKNFLIVLSTITSIWCFSSIIIEFVKMYTLKEDSKEIFRATLNILKSVIYVILMGTMTLIVNGVYNNTINLDVMTGIIIVVVGLISILISIIYKLYTRKVIKGKEEDNGDE